jgi:hypothetical protein
MKAEAVMIFINGCFGGSQREVMMAWTRTVGDMADRECLEALAAEMDLVWGTKEREF